MKKLLQILCILCVFLTNAQVTRIWSDYNNFWTSGNNRNPTSGGPLVIAQDINGGINPIAPNTTHNLLAFRWTRPGFTPNSVVFSTGVNDARLTSNGVSFTAGNFRALPINEVPISGGAAYFIALGALTDGNQTNITNPAPFGTITSTFQKASYLTDGVRGLGLGSGLTNIPVLPVNAPLRFNMSTNGITLASINNGIPDILVSQIAQPENTADILRFVRSNGTVVGNPVTITLTDPAQFPAVANWNLDLYNNDGTQTDGTRINTSREVRFFATDVSAFGITTGNYTEVVALEYLPSGNSDPAFIAFNEPSLGISTRLGITSPDRTTNCDGVISGNFTVQLQDRLGAVVQQAGIPITAGIETGSGLLLGTVTQLTNVNGLATFNDLAFETGGLRTIRFSNTSLTAAITPPIPAPANCNDLGPYVWTGDLNQRWNNGLNWTRLGTPVNPTNFPNANHDVVIPSGRPGYPNLVNNAGARNLVMEANTTVTINSAQFAITGTITADSTAKIIANTDDGILYFAGTTAQNIPNGIIQNGNVANLTIENAAGVTNADNLRISQVLSIRTGTFNTGGTVTMSCRFSSPGPPPLERRTALIGPIGSGGSIIGNMTTEQCFPARRAFRFVTSSVTTPNSIRANWQENATAWNNNPNPGYGTHITGLGAGGSNPLTTDRINGFDWQPSGNNSMFTFNNATQQYQAITSTLTPLTAGTPYYMLIRGNRSTDIRLNGSPATNTILRATGTIRQGDVNVSSQLSSTANHYNLIGNPYQSVVDMGAVLGAATNLTPFYWVYDPRINSRGGFVAVNAVQNTQQIPASQANNFLQPYQAFFVQTGTLGIAPIMIFTEANKVTTVSGSKRLQTATFRVANKASNSLNSTIDEEFGNGISNQWLSLSLFTQTGYVNKETALDGLRIDFNEGSTNDVTNMDAAKFVNSDENLSRKLGTSLISMENRATAINGEILPIEITTYRSTAYTMEFDLSSFTNQIVYLKDNFTNQTTLLTNGAKSTYNFTVSDAAPTSKNPDRFAIEIRDATLSTQNSTLPSSMNLFPNPSSGNEIFVNAAQPFKNGRIEVYNMLGQKIVNFIANANTNNQVSIPITGLNTGIYMVNLTTETGEKYASKFIRN